MKASEHPFIHQLRTDGSLLDRVEQVAEGDWDHLLQVARQAGHRLDKESLIRLFPSGFYRGHGKHPELGWPMDHHTLPANSLVPIVLTWRFWKGCTLSDPAMQRDLRTALTQHINALGWKPVDVSVTPKSAQLHLEYPVHTSLGKALESIRAKTSLAMKQAFSDLKQQLGHVPLWAPETGIHPAPEAKKSTPSVSTTTQALHP